MSGVVTQALFNEFLKAHNNTAKGMKDRITELEEKLNRLHTDFVSLYDLVYAHDKIQKKGAISTAGLNQFTKDKLSLDFNEMSADLKINALLQFLEAATVNPPAIYNKFIIDSFRLRNRIAPLHPSQAPEKGDFALISWQFADAEGTTIYSKQEYAAYFLGNGALGVDDDILLMKVGEQKFFDLAFPESCPTKALAGKSGKLTVLVHSFERYMKKVVQEVSEEKKQEIWDEKYESHSIE